MSALLFRVGIDVAKCCCDVLGDLWPLYVQADRQASTTLTARQSEAKPQRRICSRGVIAQG
jgi:hypothetical protein